MLPVVGWNETKFCFISGVRTSWNWSKSAETLHEEIEGT